MKITYGRCAIAGCALLIAAQGAVAASPGKEGDPLYHASVECVGSGTIAGAESMESGLCVFTDPDGDRFFSAYSVRNKEPGTWKTIAGTGKFEGMEASGTWARVLAPDKPARADIAQSCDKGSGHWKLK